jgi:hypothetical protein
MTHYFSRFAAALLLLVTGVAWADELSLTGKQLLDLSYSRNVKLAEKTSSIELTRGYLIEHDGNAAGFSYRPNEELLKADVVARKVFDFSQASSYADKRRCASQGVRGDFALGKAWQIAALPVLGALVQQVVNSSGNIIPLSRWRLFGSAGILPALWHSLLDSRG